MQRLTTEMPIKCIIIIQVIMICLTSCEETLFEDEPTSPESSDEVEEHEHDLPDHFQTLKTEEELQNQFLQYANNIIEEIEDFERSRTYAALNLRAGDLSC